MPGAYLWIWDTANTKWVKAAGTATGALSIHAIVDELNDIGDVNVAAPTDGYVLYWDETAGEFKLKAVVGGYTEGARAYHDAIQAIPDDTYTYLDLNSERYDTDNIHDLITNNSRLTFKTAGIYLIISHVEFVSNATGLRKLIIKINRTTNVLVYTVEAITGDSTTMIATTLYSAAVDDYVENMVYQNSGGALNVPASTGFQCELMVQRIG